MHGETEKKRYFPKMHKMVIIPNPSTETGVKNSFKSICLAYMTDKQDEIENSELGICQIPDY